MTRRRALLFRASLRSEAPPSPLHPFSHRRTIKDVRIQLTRNSLVHGLESAQERERAGKNREGVIKISSFRENGSLRILFRNDGRGLEVGKLRRKAGSTGKR